MNSEDSISLGFDIGGTNIRGVALRTDLSFGETISESCEDDHEKIIQTLVRVANRIQGKERLEIKSIGIGVAGFIDKSGVVRTSPNLSTFADYPLLEQVRHEFDIPVLIENDATSATWAEVQLGAAREAKNAIMVCLGTGIGAGLYINSELARGASGFAGEVGHMVIVPDGLQCPCGRSGCWERYASGASFGNIAEASMQSGESSSLVNNDDGFREPFQSEWISRLVLARNQEALNALDEFGYWVALGLANLVNIFDPEKIVLGGGITEIGAPLLESVKRSYERMTPERSLRSKDMLVLAQFGNGAGAIGAALLAMQNFSE